ncbi:hypothetical protein MNBD_ALPHA11-431 [hydrothermal vent metagenome]|uniref:Uncharacterized protein n=1 Tax=hydrothermal vent metagenome TaxID=652676 RepID=A0A3B0UK23_9ZZZZ
MFMVCSIPYLVVKPRKAPKFNFFRLKEDKTGVLRLPLLKKGKFEPNVPKCKCNINSLLADLFLN